MSTSSSPRSSITCLRPVTSSFAIGATIPTLPAASDAAQRVVSTLDPSDGGFRAGIQPVGQVGGDGFR